MKKARPQQTQLASGAVAPKCCTIGRAQQCQVLYHGSKWQSLPQSTRGLLVVLSGTNLEFYLLATLWKSNSCKEGVAGLALD